MRRDGRVLAALSVVVALATTACHETPTAPVRLGTIDSVSASEIIGEYWLVAIDTLPMPVILRGDTTYQWILARVAVNDGGWTASDGYSVYLPGSTIPAYAVNNYTTGRWHMDGSRWVLDGFSDTVHVGRVDNRTLLSARRNGRTYLYVYRCPVNCSL